MDSGKALELLSITSAVRDGHFLLTSGLHAGKYVLKDAIYLYPRIISRLCYGIAEQYEGKDIAVVVAPAVGGVILSQWVAYHLSQMTGRDVLAVYAEKGEGGFVLNREYDKVVTGKRVLVSEDVLTTGGSVEKVIKVVQVNGGEVIGVGALWNRGQVNLEVPLYSLVNIAIDSFKPDACPLCVANIPLTVGIGKAKAQT